MADIQATGRTDAPHDGQSLASWANWIGAAVSLMLLVGVVNWGYRLLVRDVHGVPVVRAAEGPMRVQPDDPGGKPADNMGLAVNDVAAKGAAEAPADRLVLAPPPLELSDEDVPAAALGDDGQASDGDDEGNMAALVEELTARATPLAPEAGENDAETAPAAADAAPATETETEPMAGLGRSLRPQLRPQQVVARLAAADAAVSAGPATPEAEVDPATIAPGTRLVQLGAFDSAEVARSEWTRLSGRFGDYLAGKKRVIQRAESGGRIFYRLRAMGFADLADARRFCSALVAENADCIPVVTR